MQSIKKMHYGWVVVLAGALVMGTTHGVIANCFSLYLKPVTEELHLSRQGFSTCQMIVNLLYMAVSLVSGRIYRKVSPHLLMKIAALTLPASKTLTRLIQKHPGNPLKSGYFRGV